MNNRRKLIVALGASALAVPLGAFGQSANPRRFGFLGYGSRQSIVDAGRFAALAQGMREAGYVEGRNYVLEERFSDGDATRLDALAADLVRLNVEIILSSGTPAHQAAQRATRIIPIVALADADPVGNGLAASLARPGGNITGMSTSAADLAQKLFELAIAAVPKLSRVAVLGNPSNSSHPPMLHDIRAAAKKSNRQVLAADARTSGDIERAFAAMAREKAGAAIILIDGFFFTQGKQISDLAMRHRLPSISANNGFAGAGGLMNYGTDFTENYRRAAVFVDKILKGAKPADLPFEQPMRYSLEVNRKTASVLGIKISQELLLRADKVIE
jgi:putative ABC transport system substrate-binding protein